MGELIAATVAETWARLGEPRHAVAFASAALAGAFVIAGALVKTMIPLRWLAVASNVGFIVYGLLHPNLLMVVLHGLMLPANLWRVAQMMRLVRQVSAASLGRQEMERWLRPHMRRRRLAAGTRVFERGDAASRLYLLAEGRIELPEVQRTIQAGSMFGEIAFFAPEGRRSSSAVCATDCTLLSIDEAAFMQLLHQEPAFGLQMLRLVAARLSQDVQRLQAAAGEAGPVNGR
jgi:hypothetical protein